MVNRIALRELQTRLASRLQAARTEDSSIAWLAIKAGGIPYLLPLVQSGEIFPLDSLQRVPYCQSWFCGVVNLRGGLFGVVDLAAFVVNGEPTPVAASAAAAGHASVVTLHPALEVNCALMIDSLEGLRSTEAFADSAPPPPDAPVYFGNRYTDSTGVVWQEINLQSLAGLPQFLSITA
jgi:twitching motility protein PilI